MPFVLFLKSMATIRNGQLGVNVQRIAAMARQPELVSAPTLLPNLAEERASIAAWDLLKTTKNATREIAKVRNFQMTHNSHCAISHTDVLSF